MHGYATFPGVLGVIEADISVVEGISPSVCTLTITPQAQLLQEGGTLRIGFGSIWVDFQDCKVDSGSIERNAAGEIWRLRILDRRWKWAFGAISGSYNLRNADTTLQTDTEKTPRELATRCLEVMNETGYDVSALPVEPRPTVQWDYDVPMEALASLCDALNCRVCLSLETGKVKIVKVGEGAPLPYGPVVSGGATVNPPEMPTTIAVVGAPIRYQHDFELEAVGLDTDGTIKPIDNLSYKPSAGWASCDIEEFDDVLEAKGKREQNLARQSVFRWYRIKQPMTIRGFRDIDGSTVVQTRRQVLPIFDELAETILQTNQADGTKELRNRPSLVYGIWCPDADSVANITSTLTPPPTATVDEDDAVYVRSHNVNTELGIVMFDAPVFRNTANAAANLLSYGPATLYLRASCNARSRIGLALFHYNRERATGAPFDTRIQYVHRPDIEMSYIPEYDRYGNVTLTDNKAEADKEADYWIDATLREYQATLPQTTTYAGLVMQDLDGAIQQITFAVTQRGTFTTISRNDEQLTRTLPYRFRRQQERAKAEARTTAIENGIAPTWRPGTRWDNTLGRFTR